MPKQLTDFNFTSNPFDAVFNQGDQRTPDSSQGFQSAEGTGENVRSQPQGEILPMRQGAFGAGVTEQPQTAQAAGQLNVKETEPEVVDQFQSGQNGDGLKSLISATQGLEKFITESTSKEAIMMARGLVGALGRLMTMGQTLAGQGVQTPGFRPGDPQPAPLLQ